MGVRQDLGKLKIGDKCPDFSLPAVDGKTYSRDGLLEGKKGLVVVFSCNHCPYVRAYEDRMIALAKETAPKGIAWAAVCSNDAERYPDDSFEEMKKRAEEKGFPFPYLHDETQEVARAFDAAATPEFYLFDAAGKLAYHGRLDDEMEEDKVTKRYLADAIEALLAGRPADPAKTHAIGCTIKWK